MTRAPCTGMAVYGLDRDAVCPAGHTMGGSVCGGSAGVYPLLEGFPRSKRRNCFGRNLEHVPRAWVTACTRLAVPEPEASKAPQFHCLPRLERVHNGLQELRDDRVCLVLRELHSSGDVIDEICLCHTHLSSV